MKFLCVSCDEPMRLERTEGPEKGSLTAIFACPRCANKVAMLANPIETQLVRALDVRVGGPGAPSGPLEFVRSTLAKRREGLELDTAAPQPGFPGADRQSGNIPIGQSGRPCQVAGSPDCQIAWSPEAERRLERVPDFIRPMARQGIERFAVERGYRRITEEVMDEARVALGH